jgi:hypothetical protein
MTKTGNATLAALVILMAVSTASSQDGVTGDSGIGLPGKITGPRSSSRQTNVSGVPLSQKRKWAPLVQIESVLPSLSTLRSAGDSEVAVNVGGALQSYLATNRVDLTGRMYDLVAPFGATAVVSVAGGKAEIHGGVVGAFIPFSSPYSRPNAWLTQASFGLRLRLDSGSHFWLGATSYYLVDFADEKRQRGYSSADLTVRFGNQKTR